MKSFLLSHNLLKANTRVKYFIDSDGELHPYELTCLSNPIYNRYDGYEELSTKKSGFVDNSSVDIISDNSEITDDSSFSDGVRRSLARARKKCRDYVTCNFCLSLFVTLTLNRELIDRYSYSDVIRKLNVWLDNSVRRRGLRYILIPEYHKDGAIHFHGLFSDSLRKVDSGHKRKGKVVYNLDFPYGFTTAIYIEGEDSNRKVANYCLKYMTKTDNKVGGRWYLHGGKLAEPLCEYYNISIDDIPAPEYDIAGFMTGKTIFDELTISELLTEKKEFNCEV